MNKLLLSNKSVKVYRCPVYRPRRPTGDIGDVIVIDGTQRNVIL